MIKRLILVLIAVEDVDVEYWSTYTIIILYYTNNFILLPLVIVCVRHVLSLPIQDAV